MSNHATVNYRPPVDDRWKRECNRDLGRCAQSCAGLAANLAATRQKLGQLSRDLEPLRRNRIPQVDRVGALLRQAEVQLDAVAARTDDLTRVGRRLGERGRQSVRRTTEQAHAMDRQLAEDQIWLRDLARDLAGAIDRTYAIGRELERLLGEADHITDQIHTAEREGRVLNQRLHVTWQEGQAVMAGLGVLGEAWGQLGTALDRDLAALGNQVAVAQVQLEALERNEPATHAVLQGLLRREYELVHLKMADSGIEAFLRDREGRKVAFQARRDALPDDEILLELDLEGFDTEGEACACDRELDAVLEDLAETEGGQRCTRVHPHQGRSGPDLLLAYPHRQLGKTKTQKRTERDRA